MNRLYYGDTLPILRDFIATAKEAVSAGFVEIDMGTGTTRLRKVQILTIEDLMNGARPELPLVDSTAFRRARRGDTDKQAELDL